MGLVIGGYAMAGELGAFIGFGISAVLIMLEEIRRTIEEKDQ
jgi:hypothetical protein